MKKLLINFTCGNQYQCDRTIEVVAEAYREEGCVWNLVQFRLFRNGGYGFQIEIEYPGENPVAETTEMLELLQGKLLTRYKKEEFEKGQEFTTSSAKATVLRTI